MPHRAHGIVASALFQAALGDARMPARQAVEIAEHGPDLVQRRVDDGGDMYGVRHTGSGDADASDQGKRRAAKAGQKVRFLNSRVAAVSACSVGRRSIELAP
ncbi:hypothetical protein D3C72_2147570 [compost metagenome]